MISLLLLVTSLLTNANAEIVDEFCEQENSPNPMCVTTSDFIRKVVEADPKDLIIVQPTARWCVYCRRLKAEMPDVLKDPKLVGKTIRFYSMNYDVKTETSNNQKFLNDVMKVYQLPSLHFFVGGEQKWEIQGAPFKLQLIRDFGYAADAAQAGLSKIEPYPTLLRDAQSLTDQIKQFFHR